MTKKLIAGILLIACFLTLSSCGNEKYNGYIVKEIGNYDLPLFGGNHNHELELGGKSKQEIFYLLSKKKFSYGDKEFNANYSGTSESPYYKNTCRLYETSDSKMKWGVNIYSKEIVWFSIIAQNNADDKQKTIDECESIAKEYLSQYIDDISNYKIESGGDSTGYRFNFTRVVDGIEIKDSAHIAMDINGNIIRFFSTCLGEFKDYMLPSEEKMEQYDKAAFAKMEAIYSEEHKNYNVNHEIQSKTISRLANGNYIIEYWIETRWDKNPHFDKTNLVVYI